VVKVSRQRRDLDETLTAQPPYALVGVVRVPETQISPVRAIWRRVAIALLAEGRLRLRANKSMPMQQAADAHRQLESGTVHERIVLTLP